MPDATPPSMVPVPDGQSKPPDRASVGTMVTTSSTISRSSSSMQLFAGVLASQVDGERLRREMRLRFSTQAEPSPVGSLPSGQNLHDVAVGSSLYLPVGQDSQFVPARYSAMNFPPSVQAGHRELSSPANAGPVGVLLM